MITRNLTEATAMCQKSYEDLLPPFPKPPDMNAYNKVQQVERTIQCWSQTVGLDTI